MNGNFLCFPSRLLLSNMVVFCTKWMASFKGPVAFSPYWKVTRVTSWSLWSLLQYFCHCYIWNDKIVSCTMLGQSSDPVSLLWPLNSRCWMCKEKRVSHHLSSNSFFLLWQVIRFLSNEPITIPKTWSFWL